jgi:DNA (cytosine-5)-methyltransferase 1
MNKAHHKPTAIDLFCGCGGFSLGFMQGGWNVVCGIDTDFDALNTYWCNLCGDDSIWVGDIPKKKRREHKLANPGNGWISNDENAQGVTPVHVAIHDNIRNYHGHDLLRLCELDTVDCIIGSPPCGSFSKQGKREIGDPRDSLPFEYVRIVLEIDPKTLTMENVPEFTKKKLPDGRKVVDCFTKILRDKDWDLYYSILGEYGGEES